MITPETLPQATAQQVFDQVARHLLYQNAKSLSIYDNTCQYRVGRLSCAAGCLIGEEEYHPEMEGLNWHELVGQGKVPGEHSQLIQRLQHVHDQNDPVTWKEELENVARERKLSWRH